MPIIYSSESGSSNDGYVAKDLQSSWANARDATSGSSRVTSSTASANFAKVYKMNFRGGGVMYGVSRSFMVFDTSGITGTVASATLSVYGYSANDGSVIAVKGTAFGGDGNTGLAKADIDAIDGWSAGSSLAGSATVYGSQILTTNWSISGYNDFTATSDLLADMKNNDVVIIAFMDYTYDYLNVAPGFLFPNIGGYYANYTGTSRDPKIDYTLGPSGYANTVNGVAAANIGKINGVATASISKVNGI